MEKENVRIGKKMMKSLNDGPCVPKIAIVDYSMGNIGSVTKVLKRLNVEYKLLYYRPEVGRSDHITGRWSFWKGNG